MTAIISHTTQHGWLVMLGVVWLLQAGAGMAIWWCESNRKMVPHEARKLRSVAYFGGLVPLPGIIVIQLASFVMFRVYVARVLRTSERLRAHLAMNRKISEPGDERHAAPIRPAGPMAAPVETIPAVASWQPLNAEEDPHG